MAYMSAADDHSNNTPESRTYMRIRLTAGETVLNIPAPGIVILGEINSGADALKKYDGTVGVTIEAVD